jgi:aryl-alcohol dehydrogenase-like predicted oxidoreductase
MEQMQYRTLGASGVKVSPLCLGTMMFGGATDEPTAGRIVAKAKEQGVNFIDSADGYAGGHRQPAS